MTDQTQPAPKSRTIVMVCAFLFLVVCIVFLAQGFIDSRSTARRTRCSNNLQEIALAIHCYNDVHGCYPPSFIADANGKPMHSWRILVSPFLGKGGPYKYSFDEPWDGPNNRKLHDVRNRYFECQSQGHRSSRCETNYVVVAGPKTMWPGANARVRDADLIDGPSNTLMLVEVADSGIHWMEPRDLQVDQMPMAINASQGQGISSHHPGGAHLTFANGSVRFFGTNTPANKLRELLKSPPPKKPNSLPEASPDDHLKTRTADNK